MGAELMAGGDRWADRDLPVLRALVDYFDEHPGGMLDDAELQRLVQLEQGVEGSLRRLGSGDYIVMDVQDSLGGPSGYIVRDVTERALRTTGAWPSPEEATQRLLDALQQAVEEAATPEERTRRQKAVDGLRSLTGATLSGVMATVIGTAITG